MKIINKHITFAELKGLLDDSNTREDTLAQLKLFSSENDEIQGLISFLEKNDWDYSAVLRSEDSSQKDFAQTLEQHNQKVKHKSWLKLAAVLLPLIGFGAVFYVMFSSPSEMDLLYSKYTVKEYGLPTLMNTNSEKEFDEAMSAFKDESYDEAKAGFLSLSKDTPLNDTLNYFIACSDMELNNFESAVSHLYKIDNYSVFKDEVDFRIVLCKIKMNELEEGKVLLQAIAENQEHTFFTAAKNMLKEPAFKEDSHRNKQ